MNKIILVGNTTKDTESKDKMAKTSIAVKRDFKNAMGGYDSDFFDLVAFNNQAEFLSNYVHKGDKICVSGRLQTRSYQAQDGSNRKVYEIIVESVENISPKKQELQEVEYDKDFTDTEISDDVIPF